MRIIEKHLKCSGLRETGTLIGGKCKLVQPPMEGDLGTFIKTIKVIYPAILCLGIYSTSMHTLIRNDIHIWLFTEVLSIKERTEEKNPTVPPVGN